MRGLRKGRHATGATGECNARLLLALLLLAAADAAAVLLQLRLLIQGAVAYNSQGTRHGVEHVAAGVLGVRPGGELSGVERVTRLLVAAA